MIVPNKVYRAIIKGLSNTTDGKYDIYIPTLMSHDSGFNGCVAKNKVSQYGKWMDPETKEVKSIGIYIPLQVGMMVEVVFETTQYDSANIIGLVYDQIPLNKDDQQNFYLFGKTKNGTQIYVDESRNITHVMHNKGLANIILFDDKISLSVNETSDAGTNNLSNIEIGSEAITLKVGNTTLLLDESGLTLVTKDNKWEFGNKEMNFKTSKYSVEANEFSVVADKVFINGSQENHIKGNVTRVSGNQHLSLTGVTVNVASENNLTLKTMGFLNISSTLKCLIDCDTSVQLKSSGLISLLGTQTHIDGNSVTINGEIVAVNGSTISMDGQLLTNLGVSQGLCNSGKISSIGLEDSMELANISLTSALHMGDVGTGTLCNTLGNTVNGSAQSAPTPMPIPNISPRFDYINTCLKYMNQNTEIGNIGTYDNINSLNGNYLPNIFYKNT